MTVLPTPPLPVTTTSWRRDIRSINSIAPSRPVARVSAAERHNYTRVQAAAILEGPPPAGALPSPPPPRYNRRAMSFPETRLRRFRRTPTLRRLVRETRLSPDNLVLPLFVCPGEGVAKPVGSMPGVYQQSVDRIVE